MKICIISACFGWCYVDKLTANYGLLDFIPQYYPKPLESLLSCSYCVGGWTSIISTLYYWYYDLVPLMYVITIPFCTMAAVGLVIKINQ